MPVHLILQLSRDEKLALWRIDEEESLLASLCTAAEQQEVAAFASPSRRSEYLAWHALLHVLSPGMCVTYDTEGGPVLVPPRSCGPFQKEEPSPLHHIGVSHTHGYVAIILSSCPCAVDIEPLSTDFSNVEQRIISPQEKKLQQHVHPENLFPALVWCAKEAAYKWARTGGLSLLHDVHITDVRPEQINPCLCSHEFDPEFGSEFFGRKAPVLKTPHRLTVAVADKTLCLHGFVVEELCCVYGGR